jgi:hypothetical protein
MGDNPGIVKAPRDWLLKATREELGEEWSGSPLVALMPSGGVDYMNGTYNILDERHDVGPSPIIELTDGTNWPTHKEQEELAAHFEQYYQAERMLAGDSL